MFLGESFPLGNYVGDNSSERHSEAISRGILSGGNYLWDNFQGAIIQGTIPRGGQFSSRAIILGGNCPWSNYPVGNCPDIIDYNTWCRWYCCRSSTSLMSMSLTFFVINSLLWSLSTVFSKLVILAVRSATISSCDIMVAWVVDARVFCLDAEDFSTFRLLNFRKV